MSDEAILCPSCGAPLAPMGSTGTIPCKFCHQPADLAKLSVLAAAAGKITDLRCPRCDVSLYASDAHDVRMLGCHRCGGIWLDTQSAKIAMEHLDKAVVDHARTVSTSAKAREDVRPIVNCASCQKPMNRTKFVNVDIDVCAEHGTWFDAGELAVVLASLRTLRAKPGTADIPDNPTAANAFGALAEILSAFA